MQPNPNYYPISQSGFTLIELMIVIAVIGILASIATASYQTRVRQSQLISIYKEMSYFRLPYQILTSEGAGVISYSPSGLNMPAQTEFCNFSVATPIPNSATPNAVVCQIRNLNYLNNQSLTLDYNADGSWHCRASSDILNKYLPIECR